LEGKASKELIRDVIDEGLCTLCGGCLSACPYLVLHNGRVVRLHKCNPSEGQCYEFCPRTYTDMNAISQRVFGVPYVEDELGIVRDAFLARSTDKEIHKKSQDGGCVTTILIVALEEGIIDAVITTRMSADKTPQGFLARSRNDLIECAGVSYEPSPLLETLNHIPKENKERLAIVGLPCHVTAVAKMKTCPPLSRVSIDNVKLVIGLFCGWTLANGFHQFLQEKFDLSQVVKFDIPHHPSHTFDTYTESGKESIELDEIRKFINPACGYCWDMTAEFADVSIGSGRTKFKGWNTVIVRTGIGAELIDMAKRKGSLETQPIPNESLINLKRAVANKRNRALNNIVAKSGDRENLLYLGLSNRLLEQKGKQEFA
jgi:coenzyme F420 hydrogenase subunit beta